MQVNAMQTIAIHYVHHPKMYIEIYKQPVYYICRSCKLHMKPCIDRSAVALSPRHGLVVIMTAV